ncbi:unnamed protein product, partial [Clonostachys rosea f. rosea IK726]
MGRVRRTRGSAHKPTTRSQQAASKSVGHDGPTLRPIKYKSRSQPPCVTWMEKHLRCDGTKPCCQGCQDRGEKCGGYDYERVSALSLDPDPLTCVIPTESGAELETNEYPTDTRARFGFWEKATPKLRKLYFDEKKSVEEIKDEMERDGGFPKIPYYTLFTTYHHIMSNPTSRIQTWETWLSRLGMIRSSWYGGSSDNPRTLFPESCDACRNAEICGLTLIPQKANFSRGIRSILNKFWDAHREDFVRWRVEGKSIHQIRCLMESTGHPEFRYDLYRRKIRNMGLLTGPCVQEDRASHSSLGDTTSSNSCKENIALGPIPKNRITSDECNSACPHLPWLG